MSLFNEFGLNYNCEDNESLFFDNGNDNFFLTNPNELNNSILDISMDFHQDNFESSIEVKSKVNVENSYFFFPKCIPLEEEEGNLNFQCVNAVQNDEDISKIKLSNSNNSSDKGNNNSIKGSKSTRPTSDKCGESRIKAKIFSCRKIIQSTQVNSNSSLPNYFRLDMAKKYFKVQISQFATDIINRLIENSDLPDELKNPIHLPNSKEFTSKSTESANYKFLSNTIREIFTIGKEKVELQKKNDEYFNIIYEYFEKIGIERLSDNLKKVKEFIEMTYEDLIKMYYKSIEFNYFKEDIKTKFYDNGIKAEKGFSLLEDYGLIKLFKITNKKRKRD